MLQSNNKSQNKSLWIIIIVALLFTSFANIKSTLKTYAQEKVANHLTMFLCYYNNY
jgi:flagellar basal body-associated protein FliL